MAWTGIPRQEHSRGGLGISIDVTDRAWQVPTPFIHAAKRNGQLRTADMRDLPNALLYIAASGCG